MHGVKRLGLFVIGALAAQCVLTAHSNSRSFNPAATLQKDDALSGLAADLVSARDDDERAALIERHKESIDLDLRKALVRRAFRLCLRGDYSDSLDVIHVLELLAAHKGDKAWIAVPTIASVVVYYLQGNFAKALESYRKMPPIAEIEHDRAATAWVLSIRGFLAYFRGNYTQALKDCSRSLELLDPVQDKSEIAFTLTSTGMVNSAQGQHTQALDYYQRALAICRETGDMSLAVVPLNNIGVVYHEQFDDDQALKYYKDSLDLGRQLGIGSLSHYTLNNMGDAYYRLGDYLRAMDCFKQSLDLRKELGNKAEIAITLKDIGEILQHSGQFDGALGSYQESLELDQAIGDRVAMTDRLEHLGMTYLDEGNYRLALEYFEKRLSMSQALDDKEGIGDAFSHIATLYIDQNNSDLALDFIHKSLDARKATGNKDQIANGFADLGRIEALAGAQERAFQDLEAALHQYEELGRKRGIAQTLFAIAALNARAGKYSLAMDHCQKSLALAETLNARPLVFAILQQMAYIEWLQGNYSRASELAERAAAVVRQFRSADKSRELTSGLEGLIHRSLGQLDRARKDFQDAIAAVETVRVEVAGGEPDLQRFFEGSVWPYYEMVDLLVSQNMGPEAFGYAERAKARVIVDVLQNGKVTPARLATAGERAEEQRLKGQIVSLNTQIYREGLRPQPRAQLLADLNARLADARHALEAFRTSLYAAHPDLRVARGETLAIDIQQASPVIPDDKTAILEYVVGQKRTFAFVITATGAGANRTCDLKISTIEISRDELNDGLRGYRDMLATHGLGFRKPASDLYRLLLGPAERLLQGKTRLIIVPDGPLWDLPFQALQRGNNRFLLEDLAISYAPSVTALLEMTRKRNGQSPSTDSSALLAVATTSRAQGGNDKRNRAYRGAGLASIPEAEEEARGIAALYGETRSKVLIGTQAREDLIKEEAPRYRILHFATHGRLDDSSPMYSQLVLAQPGPRGGNDRSASDGLLEAWEIMQMDLKADLVVLSACETARGRIGSGEGVVGMSWAFFVAGSPATVVSQWKVDSASTTRMMVDFHRNLTRGVNKAESLRQAALQLLHTPEYQHPFYWAPFVVVGDAL